jgi:hypothetical protein
VNEVAEPKVAGLSIDRFLDSMFDGLAGTGAAGRRTLAETEDHLRSAVADGATEAEAIGNFGSPTALIRAARRARRGPWLLSILSGGWLFAGLAVTTFGLAVLARATEIGVLLVVRPDRLPQCAAAPLTGPFATLGECSDHVSAMRSFLVIGGVVIGVGAVMLGLRWLLIHRAGFAAPGRGFGYFAVPAMAALTVGTFVDDSYGFNDPLGEGGPIGWVMSIAGLAMTLAIAVWSVRSRNRVTPASLG